MVKKTASLIIISVLLVGVIIITAKTDRVLAVHAQTTTGASPNANSSTTGQGQEKVTTREAKTNQITALQQARKEFRERLLTIKDEAKQRIVGKLDERIAEINENKTDRYLRVLDVLQIFVDRASESSNAASLTDIENAQNAIDTARAAVVVQAEKVYTMNITSEATLRANAGEVISEFKKDISAVYKLVHSAKLAVQKLYINGKLIKKGASESAGM